MVSSSNHMTRRGEVGIKERWIEGKGGVLKSSVVDPHRKGELKYRGDSWSEKISLEFWEVYLITA